MPYERKTETINSSKEFRDLLSHFSKTSDVAKILSKERISKDILVGNHVDYISISESDPSKISYLTNDRVKLIISKGECLWTSPIRFCCKPGSFVSKILKGIDSKSIETFSNQYRSFASKEQFRFEILKGESIPLAYIDLNYASQRGSLGTSCMKYEKCQDYFGIYENNSCVSILVMKNKNDLILGRALLWNFTSVTVPSKKYKIMDRIYTIKDEDYSHYFKNWAHDNDYIHKKFQNWTKTLEFEGTDVSPEMRIGIPLDEAHFDNYPYLDTFKWLDTKDKILYNYIPDNFNHSSRYKNISLPDGYSTDFDFLAFDEIDRCWIYKSDSISINIDSISIATSVNNCTWSETLDRYLLLSESHWNVDLQDNIYRDLSRVDPSIIQARVDLITSRNSLYSDTNRSTLNSLREISSTFIYDNIEF